MTISCMIVDDEPLAVRLLESFVAKTPELKLLASFTDSVEAINAIKEQQPNLLFLDIQMPDLNGMELAHMIPSETRVVFTTAFKEYAFESYEVSALDFLLKPIRYNKFIAAVEKAEQWFAHSQPASTPLSSHSSPLTSSKTSMFLRVDGELRQVNFDKILYVEGMKDYVRFHLEDERLPLTTHMTMKAVEDALPADAFMRINRSYVVRLDKIRTVDTHEMLKGKYFFDGFHRQMGNQRLAYIFEIEHNVVFHATDVKNL